MDKSLELLLNAAKEVGGAAWPILVRAEWVSAMISVLITGPALVVMAAASLWFALRVAGKHANWEYGPDNGWAVAQLIGNIVGPIVLLVGLLVIGSHLSAFIYPEGAALMSIIHRGE